MNPEEIEAMLWQSRQRQRRMEFANHWFMVLLLLNIFVAADCAADFLLGGGWTNLLPVLSSTWCSAACLSGWRNHRKICLARRAFCRAMEGIYASACQQLPTAFEHHDDQSNAALSEMTRLIAEAGASSFRLRISASASKPHPPIPDRSGTG